MQPHTTEEEDRQATGQVSRARQWLTGVALAPKSEDTNNLLQGRRPQEQIRLGSEVVLDFRLEAPLRLKKTVFSQCLREAPLGSSSGPGKCSNDPSRVLG